MAVEIFLDIHVVKRQPVSRHFLIHHLLGHSAAHRHDFLHVDIYVHVTVAHVVGKTRSLSHRLLLVKGNECLHHVDAIVQIFRAKPSLVAVDKHRRRVAVGLIGCQPARLAFGRVVGYKIQFLKLALVADDKRQVAVTFVFKHHHLLHVDAAIAFHTRFYELSRLSKLLFRELLHILLQISFFRKVARLEHHHSL